MRFIGSKTLLLGKINDLIKSHIDNANSFCDIFSGTSTVARYFKKDYKIISNDLLHFSYVLQKASIENQQYPNFERIKTEINTDPLSYFNQIDVSKEDIENTPFIHNNYSPSENCDRMYFTNQNALKIDFIRQKIEEWKQKDLLDNNEYYFLIASLIEAVPYVSNIAGTYGSFLKHWDKRAFKDINMIKVDTIDNKQSNKCFNEDSNRLIKKINGDILYIDPPYNSRQYGPNYHLLETISRYDSPDIYGSTGLRPYNDIKSDYCSKVNAVNAFSELIKHAKFNHIIVSYSTEGIMSIDDIKNILLEHGIKNTYVLQKIPYRRYKHTKGFVNHDLCELLFYIEKDC